MTDKVKCPDGGACHHGCRKACWRVLNCAPLSCFGEEWNTNTVQYHRILQMGEDMEDAAGELRVEVPEPGTTEAKLLAANVLLRRRVRELEDLLGTAMEKLGTEVYNNFHGGKR